MSFGALGFADDYIKIKKSSSDGINWKIKFLIQILLSLSIVFLILKIFQMGIIIQFMYLSLNPRSLFRVGFLFFFLYVF